MLPAGDWPPWGDPSTEEFRPVQRGRIAARFLLPYAIPVLVLGAICSGIGTIPFGHGPLGYALGGVVVVGVATAFLWRRLRRGMLSTVIRMSPIGVELRDDLGHHTRIRWADASHVGTAYTRTSDPRGVAVGGGVRYSIKAQRDLGISGWGERLMPTSTPTWQRRQQEAAPRHPRTGQPQVAIPLGAVDPHWVQGRMGAWVRQYRPDLLP